MKFIAPIEFENDEPDVELPFFDESELYDGTHDASLPTPHRVNPGASAHGHRPGQQAPMMTYNTGMSH